MPPFFTIYTPTFNRGHLLPRVYASLLAQDEKDLEWLVVDDGSSDNTELLVRTWTASAPFPIRYLRQSNQGKHVATNRAVEVASGEMFVIVDSDDWLTEGGLTAIRRAWEAIPVVERHKFASIAGLFLNTDGQPVTRLFPSDVIDCNSIEMETRFGITGEIAMATRTEVRRRFTFPENVGRYCMPSLVWNRIAACYLTRYINAPIQYKEYQKEGITLSGVARKIRLSPESFRIRSKELLEFPLPLPRKFKARCMRMYVRASLHAQISEAAQWRETSYRWLWLLQYWKGRRDYLHDCVQLEADSRK